jgi:hypothetical protein
MRKFKTYCLVNVWLVKIKQVNTDLTAQAAVLNTSDHLGHLLITPG